MLKIRLDQRLPVYAKYSPQHNRYSFMNEKNKPETQTALIGGLGIFVAPLHDISTGLSGAIVILDTIPEFTPSALKTGDRITVINGRETNNWNFRELVLKGLRGPVGQSVDLTIERGLKNKTLSIKVIRKPLNEQIHLSEEE